jgi:hypothetical protein
MVISYFSLTRERFGTNICTDLSYNGLVETVQIYHWSLSVIVEELFAIRRRFSL